MTTVVQNFEEARELAAQLRPRAVLGGPKRGDAFVGCEIGVDTASNPRYRQNLEILRSAFLGIRHGVRGIRLAKSAKLAIN